MIDDLRRELVEKSLGAAAEISRRDGRIEQLQKTYAHLDQERMELTVELERIRRQCASEAEEIAQLRDRFIQTNRLLHSQSVRLAEHENVHVAR